MKRLAIRYTGSTGTGYPFEEYTMDDKAYEILLNDFETFLKAQQPGGGIYEVSEHGVMRKLVLNFAHVTYIRLESGTAGHSESQERSFPFAVSAPKTSSSATEDEDRPSGQPTPVSPNKPVI